MKKINFVFLTIIMGFFSCENNNENKSVNHINSFISKNSPAYKLLTYGYAFKIYEDGVGKDLSKPIVNDSIIILKNDFINQIPITEINEGKVLVLDSVEICELSFDYDQKKQIMRSFLVASRKKESEKLAFSIKNWVPEYTSEGYKCVEITF